MIIKANAMLKIRVPETDDFRDKSAEEIVAELQATLNSQLLPQLQSDSGLVASVVMSTDTLRVAQ